VNTHNPNQGQTMTRILLTCIATLMLTGCVTEPDNSIITEWCEEHPWDARCSDQGGGAGGGDGGVCTPGDVGCHGPVNCSIGFRWNNVTRRCEYQNVGENCWFSPGDRYMRDILGYCQCLFPEGPLLMHEPEAE